MRETRATAHLVDISPAEGPATAAPCRWINKTFRGRPIVERVGTKVYTGTEMANQPFMSGQPVYLKG